MRGTDTADLFRRAIEALNGGNFDAAEAAAQDLLRHNPEDPGVHQLIASIRLAQKNAVDAERSIEASLSRRPDHGATLLLAGRIARTAGDLDLALYRLNRAREREPHQPDAAFEICAVLIERGEAGLRPALADLLARFPGFATGWVEVGRALERAGQFDAALAAFGQAAKTTNSAVLETQRAALLHHLGRYDDSIAALHKAFAIEPDFVPAWFKLGLVLQDRHDLTGAVVAYRRALALQADLVEAETNLGMVLQDSGDLEGAKRAYGRAILLRPESFGRIAQALTMGPKGELWMDLKALRDHLCDEGRLSR